MSVRVTNNSMPVESLQTKNVYLDIFSHSSSLLLCFLYRIGSWRSLILLIFQLRQYMDFAIQEDQILKLEYLIN